MKTLIIHKMNGAICNPSFCYSTEQRTHVMHIKS